MAIIAIVSMSSIHVTTICPANIFGSYLFLISRPRLSTFPLLTIMESCPICHTFIPPGSSLNRHLGQQRDSDHKNFIRSKLAKISLSHEQNVESSGSAAKFGTAGIGVGYSDAECFGREDSDKVDSDQEEPTIESCGLLKDNIEALLELYEEEEEDLFQFTALGEDVADGIEEGEAGPGPSTLHYRRYGRHLDDEEDLRHTAEFTDAAECIRIDADVREKWRLLFGQGDSYREADPKNGFHPFASAIDWKIAHWAITEGISQKAVDRLLAIPEVCPYAPQ